MEEQIKANNVCDTKKKIPFIHIEFENILFAAKLTLNNRTPIRIHEKECNFFG